MKTDTKLNGAIRALFKSKAREKFELAGTSKVKPLISERDGIIAAIGKDPQVSKRVKRITELKNEIDQLTTELSKLGIVPPSRGEALTFAWNTKPKKHKYHTQHLHHSELEKEIKQISACQCQKGDSPELLQFAADLSLCGTVGEAEALLAKIA